MLAKTMICWPFILVLLAGCGEIQEVPLAPPSVEIDPCAWKDQLVGQWSGKATPYLITEFYADGNYFAYNEYTDEGVDEYRGEWWCDEQGTLILQPMLHDNQLINEGPFEIDFYLISENEMRWQEERKIRVE